jgi:hypothetical protein
MAPKVPTLPLLAVRLILDLARETRPPAATDVLGGRESPVAEPRGPALPSDIVATLETAAHGTLIDGGYQVALQPDDATALSSWCRAVAPLVNPAHAGVLLVAADTIDAAA